MSLHRFCQITGLSKASAWRYDKRGWRRTHLIANRRYILAADVAEFNRRLALDEFAGSVSNLSYARSIGSKQNKQRDRVGNWQKALAGGPFAGLTPVRPVSPWNGGFG
jgi:hypothetical protein